MSGVMCDFILMLFEVINHSGKTELCLCDQAVGNHSICDASVVPAVIGGVAYADDFAVGQADLGGALDVCDVCLKGVSKPNQLQAFRRSIRSISERVGYLLNEPSGIFLPRISPSGPLTRSAGCL